MKSKDEVLSAMREIFYDLTENRHSFSVGITKCWAINQDGKKEYLFVPLSHCENKLKKLEEYFDGWEESEKAI